MRGKETPIATGEDGRVVQEVLLAGYESARTGSKVRLPFRPKGVKAPIDLWLGSRVGRVANTRMRIVVAEDYEDMSRQAAELVVDDLRRSPSLLLCAATGSSPTRAYELLAERRHEAPGLFEALRVVKLDEWGGLGPDAKGSCDEYLRRLLIGPLGIPDERYLSLRGDADDPKAECQRVAGLLEDRGPIDMCVLGLGLNGHLGFNEPADEIEPHAHVATLSETSLSHAMVRDVEGDLRYGLTLGLADIVRSKQVLLLVNGSRKRDAMRQLRERRVSTRFPASFLWLHPNAVCLCDAASAATGGP